MLSRPRTVVLLLLAGAVLMAVPPGLAALPEQTIVAAPGAWLSTFATPAVVVEADGPLTFTNTDLMHHDVLSTTAGSDDRPWCGAYAEGRCPLFWTPLISLGEETPVLGLDQLDPGTVYPFYCSLHPGMTGTLVAIERAD